MKKCDTPRLPFALLWLLNHAQRLRVPLFGIAQHSNLAHWVLALRCNTSDSTNPICYRSFLEWFVVCSIRHDPSIYHTRLPCGASMQLLLRPLFGPITNRRGLMPTPSKVRSVRLVWVNPLCSGRCLQRYTALRTLRYAVLTDSKQPVLPLSKSFWLLPPPTSVNSEVLGS